MQIDELTAKGLKRSYKIVIDAAEIEEKVEATLNDLKGRMRMPGFRPGKAPTNLLKKIHGESVRGQVLQELVGETTEKLFADKDIKPAMQPSIEVLSEKDDADFSFSLDLEILPEIKIPDFSAISLQRLITKPGDEEIDAAMARLAEQQKRFEKAPKDYKAKDGDAAVIDFTGRLDGEEFEGGAAEDFLLELGSGTLIPGFEDQLVGVKADDQRSVEVDFPEDYANSEMAGKQATFDVKVKEVRQPVETEVDEDFAKGMGFPDLKGLRESVAQQLEQDSAGLSRLMLKRALLDDLAERSKFDVPEGMIDAEFGQIWRQLQQDQIAAGEAKPEDFEGMDGPADKAERDEYYAIAERRVRLGLLLAEVGREHGVEIAQEEVNRRLIAEARRFPGQEQQVLEFYRENENAMASLRAPIYEEKVCDVILERATIKDKTVSRDELERAVEAMDEEGDAGAKASKPKKATRTKAKASKSTSRKPKSTKTATAKGAKAKPAGKAAGKKAPKTKSKS